MNQEEISEELSTHFLVKDYKWKFDYGYANPDANDISRALDKALSILHDEGDGTQLEVGRLILKNRAGVVDIFVHVGTIGEKNEDSEV